MRDYVKPTDYKGKTSQYQYPSDKVDPKSKREKEYYLSFNQAMLADYMSNNCFIWAENGKKRSISELRSYAKGQQSTEKLKKANHLKSKKDNSKYVQLNNTSFDTYFKLPQMFDVMREKNMSQEYDVSVNCIDEASIAAKEVDKNTLKFFLQQSTKDLMAKMTFKPQTKLDPEKLGLETESDVDIYFETGGYTQQRQIACSAACKKSKLVSNYKVWQDSIFDDLLILGFAGAKSYIEESTKLPKFRNVVMDNVILPKSNHLDFSDITRVGELRVMTIADIRRENPTLTADELIYIAKCHQWMNIEYGSLLSKLGDNGGGGNIDSISRVKILVLDSQWLSTDIESFMKNTTNSGRMIYKEVDYAYELDKKAKKDGQQKIQKNVIVKHESQWIVGTKHFLKFGTCKDVVYYGRDGNKTPRLDYFFAYTGNASMVERAIAIVDDIDNAVYKQRVALSTIPAAPGMAVQKDLLENVFLNGILQEPKDILQGLIEKGVLYYNGLNQVGQPLYFAGGQKPIDYLDLTKIAGILHIYTQHIQSKVNELREVLGMQNGADSGAQSAYQGLGQTKLAFQAANASLAPTFNAFNYIFKPMFDDIIKKWQIVAKDKGVRVSHSLLGNRNLAMFELDEDFSNAEFNLEIEIAASTEEKQTLLSNLNQQRQLGVESAGEQGLTASEYLYVYQRIMAGSTDEAMFVMANIEAKKLKKAEAKAKQNQQANIQDQQQSAQMKAQSDQQSLSLKNQSEQSQILITQLLKQNQELMQLMFAPKKVGEMPADTNTISSVIQSNNQQISGIISPPEPQQEQPQEEEMMQGEPNEMMQEQQQAEQMQ